ncbi:unnamed protein product [Rotaria sp. Silwood1]|nr:unnamed protein product [Rotaria sp. Silwood1]CAF1613833.1 unnamed protein product [Rotaria sp. Silwood1]
MGSSCSSRMPVNITTPISSECHIVADGENKIHSCFNSSVSKDIDLYFYDFHGVNLTADKILHDRYSEISSIERTIINKIIEEFIAKLEIEISKHLDDLQKEKVFIS